MADEAFALSPINARASLPTDADYDAICTAFMETSRGRWFLSEYAKRNRNADTRLVLDAVERIEATIASQKQPQAEPAPPVDLWPDLMKAFTKTRIEIAQRMIAETDDAAYESIRNGVEMIRKVSKALRERGWDVRICDVFDTQVSAITDGYTGLLAAQSIESSVQGDVLAAFDALAEQVEALTGGNDGSTEHLDMMVDAVADAMGEDDDFAAPASTDAEPEEAAAAPIDEDAAFHDIYACDDDDNVVETPPSEPVRAEVIAPEPVVIHQPQPTLQTESYRSVTIRVNMRPQTHQPPLDISPADDIEIVDATNEMTPPHLAMPPHQDVAYEAPQPIAQAVPAVEETVAVSRAETAIADVETAEAETPEMTPPPAAPASLGAAVLANGLVRSPETTRSDPLAPFRRMSQAERVAFFT